MSAKLDYERHKPLIRSIVYKVAGRQVAKEDVEDLVHDVIVELLAGKAAKYTPGKGMELSTFVGMIARNHTIDKMRSRSIRPEGNRYNPLPGYSYGSTSEGRPDDGDYLDKLADEEADTMGMLIRKEQLGRLSRAIAQLKPSEQVFLERIMADDVDIKAVSVELDIPMATIYARKSKLITKLKGMLASGDES